MSLIDLPSNLFRPFHSTETTLLHTRNHVYMAADKRQPALLVSLDITAALDAINHLLLVIQNLSLFLCSRPCQSCFHHSLVPPVLCTWSYSFRLICFRNWSNRCFSRSISVISNVLMTFTFTSVFASDPSASVSFRNCCLTRLHYRFSVHGLSLNPSKSEGWFDTFGTDHCFRTFPYLPSVEFDGTWLNLSWRSYHFWFTHLLHL